MILDGMLFILLLAASQQYVTIRKMFLRISILRSSRTSLNIRKSLSQDLVKKGLHSYMLDDSRQNSAITNTRMTSILESFSKANLLLYVHLGID